MEVPGMEKAGTKSTIFRAPRKIPKYQNETQMTGRFKYKNETIDIPEENVWTLKKIYFCSIGEAFLSMIQMPEAVKGDG